MLRFASLASGSRGNSLVAEARGGSGSATRVLIDCGLGPRQMVRGLRRLGLEPEDISALLITHEHDDHASGAYAFAAAYRIPLWMTRGTHHALLQAGLLGESAAQGAGGFDEQPEVRFLDGRSGFALDGLWVQPFTVPHDAREPVQYVLSEGAFRLGVVTDLGAQTAHVTEVLSGCHGLVLECNHDLELLWAGGYPRWLKERIAGPLGHMDNGMAARLLASLERGRLQHVIAAHLSLQNNRPQHAQRALSAAMGCAQEWIQLADQDLGFGWRELR